MKQLLYNKVIKTVLSGANDGAEMRKEMSRDRIVRPTLYLAWNYDSEEDALNRMSEKGWRLKKAHAFHKEYVKDSIKYIYRIDYNPVSRMLGGEKERYISTFEEMGWEYVSSVLGWNYFAKPVIDGVDEDEYQIYTDNTTLMDALSRWIRMARCLEIICIFITLMNVFAFFSGSDENLYMAALSLLEVILFEFGIVSMKRKGVNKGKTSRAGYVTGYILYFMLVAGLIATIIGLVVRITDEDVLKTKFQGIHVFQESMNYTSMPLYFSVNSGGNYDLDVYGETENGRMIMTIYSKGEAVYSASGSTIALDEDIYLKKGSYKVEVSFEFEKELSENFYSFDIEID